MLRRIVGDDAFFEGVRAFYREWRFRKAGTADFQRALQEVTRVPLGRFFAQWLEGTAMPRLRVTTERAPDGQSATVRVEQVGGVFDLPLDIAVDYLDGRSERKTVLITEADIRARHRAFRTCAPYRAERSAKPGELVAGRVRSEEAPGVLPQISGRRLERPT